MQVTGKWFGSLLLSLVLMFALSVGVISAQDNLDEDEPSIGLARLVDGDEIEIDFVNGISAHLYWFNASEGDNVVISMTQKESGFDPFLVLLGAWGEVLAFDDDGGDVPLASRIEYTIPADGGYLVLASSFSGVNLFGETDVEAVITYTISFSGATEPTEMEGYVEDVLIYYTGRAEIGEPYFDESLPTEPVYYITFIAEEGDVLDILMESDEFDTMLHLFGDFGDRLAGNDDMRGSTNSLIENFEVPMTGKYLLFATTYGFHRMIPESEDNVFEGGEFTVTITKK